MVKSATQTSSKKQQAIVAYQQQNLPEAKRLLEKVCKQDRRDAESWLLLGIINGRLGKYAKAEQAFRKIITLSPRGNASVYNNLGLALEAQDKIEAAFDAFKQALNLDPKNADAHYNLANSLVTLGHLDEAINHFELALQVQPENYAALINLGNVLQGQERYSEAVQIFTKAIAASPDSATAHYNLGNVYKTHTRLSEARQCYIQAVKVKPDYQEAWNNLGNIYMAQSDVSDSVAAHKKVLELVPDNEVIASTLVFAQSYLPSISETEKFQKHLAFVERFAKDLYPKEYKFQNECLPNRKLKIGYVSPDLRKHPVVTFFEPLLENHDVGRFETFAYSNSEKEDSVTEHLKSKFDHWQNIVHMSDHQAADHIRKDGIDILVDMAGHTAHNRLLVFASKPAPVQVTWLGYGGTTALKTMDYRIVDQHTTPPGDADQYHTEKLIRLPETFCSYQPPEKAPDVKDLPAETNGYITFGSFNNLAKLNDEVLKLWAKVMKVIPDSRLLLKSKGLNDAGTADIIQQRCQDSGIDMERLLLEGSDTQYLEKYNQVDIALDPFPYNGGTTSFDACWMGVPVLTLEGDHFYARMGVSINRNLGLNELIAKTAEECIDIAQRLASDIEYLSRVRQGLRQRMKNSPLTDGPGFTKKMETAYQEMWQTWCEHESAEKMN